MFVLEGGKVPFVLRPQDEDYLNGESRSPAYVLIGPAYLNGIMNGEAIEGTLNGQEEWQDVYLR